MDPNCNGNTKGKIMKIRIAKGAPKVVDRVEYIKVFDEQNRLLGTIWCSLKPGNGWYWYRYLRDALGLPVFCPGYHCLPSMKVELLEAAIFHQKGAAR